MPFLSLQPFTLILEGRAAITAGAGAGDDRLTELCGLDLPSALWEWGGFKEIPGWTIYFKWPKAFKILEV